MKNIFFTNISEVGKQKVPLKAKQGMSLSKTPVLKKSNSSSAKNIKVTQKTMTSIKNLVKTFNKKNPDKKITVKNLVKTFNKENSDKKITVLAAKALVKKGIKTEKEDSNYYSNMRKYAGGGLIINGVEVNNGDTGVLSSKQGASNIVITNITLKFVNFTDEEGKEKYRTKDKFIENFTPSQGGGILTKAEPQNLANRIEKLQATSIPSTDPSTWNAEYSIGDVVKIRVDMEDRYPFTKPDGTPVKYEDVENSSAITQIETLEDAKRPENPSGKLYTLGLKGTWEGKDLELAYVVDKKQSQQQTAKQQKTSTTKPQKATSTVEPEVEEPVYFDKEADFVKIYENFLQSNSDIEDYSLMSQAEVIQEIISNFEISVENLDKEIEEIKNKPKITKPKPQPQPEPQPEPQLNSNSIIIDNLEVLNEDLGLRAWNAVTDELKKLGEGWRLPTNEEFTNILYPAEDKLTNVRVEGMFWTGSETQEEGSWYFDFYSGSLFPTADISNDFFNVLPVRDLSTSSVSTTQATQASQNLDPVMLDFTWVQQELSVKLEFFAQETVELKAIYDLRLGDDIVANIGDVFSAIHLGGMYCLVPAADQSLSLIRPHDVERTRNIDTSADYDSLLKHIKRQIETRDYVIYNQEFSFTNRELIECEVRMNFTSPDSSGKLEDYGETEIYSFIDVGPMLIFSSDMTFTEKKVGLVPKAMLEILKYESSFYEIDSFEKAKIIERITEGNFNIAQRV